MGMILGMVYKVKNLKAWNQYCEGGNCGNGIFTRKTWGSILYLLKVVLLEGKTSESCHRRRPQEITETRSYSNLITWNKPVIKKKGIKKCRILLKQCTCIQIRTVIEANVIFEWGTPGEGYGAGRGRMTINVQSWLTSSWLTYLPQAHPRIASLAAPHAVEKRGSRVPLRKDGCYN